MGLACVCFRSLNVDSMGLLHRILVAWNARRDTIDFPYTHALLLPRGEVMTNDYFQSILLLVVVRKDQPYAYCCGKDSKERRIPEDPEDRNRG